MIFVLLGHSGGHILSKAFDILQPLHSLSYLREITRVKHPGSTYPNLSYTIAQRCIKELMHDRHSISAVFALEYLPMILPKTKLSAELDEACRSLTSLLSLSSTGRILAYDFLGRSFAEMGYTDAEMHKMTGEFERGACTAMQIYTKRYAKGEIPDTN